MASTTAWMDRLVAVHLSDSVPGRDFTQQKDMDRRLPGETGIINAKAVLARFKSYLGSALYMAEPFEPWGDRLHDMPAEEAQIQKDIEYILSYIPLKKAYLENHRGLRDVESGRV